MDLNLFGNEIFQKEHFQAVQTLDSTIQRISHYPVGKYWRNQLRYSVDSDLSSESVIQLLKNWGQYSRFTLSQLLHVWKEFLPSCTINKSS